MRASGGSARGAAQALAPAVLALAAGLGLAASGPQDPAREPEPAAGSASAADSVSGGAQVERGRYLVHHVAMCVQCHTPRDEHTGALVEAEQLQGGRVPVLSPYEGLEWALRAPPLAGLPGGWSAEDLSSFLQTGRSPSGRTARAPMPPFLMSEDDARAVAAYLESLAR